MNFLRKRFIFSLKYLTSPFEYRIFTLIIKKSDKLLWKQKMAFVSRLIKTLIPQHYNLTLFISS